tara:strand:- start:72 stop:434 length:363 start_codon:yes stop_codon:yes gene_type:complete
MDKTKIFKKSEDEVFSSQLWEYKIINLNVKTESNKTNNNSSSSPEKDSEKLKGVFSPDFIRNQFPEQYKKVKKDQHPAEQLQDLFNILGGQGWELIESSLVGRFQFFIFKRPICADRRAA